MDVRVEKQGDLGRLVQVKIPADEVSKKISERLESLSKSVKIEGFRQGKVPVGIVKSRFGNAVADDVANDLIRTVLPSVLEKNKLAPAGQPHVHPVGGVVDGQSFEFHAHFDVYPEFEPKGYTGLKLVREQATADDALLDGTLEKLAERFKTYTPLIGGEAAKKGDKITVTGQGYVTKDGAEEAFSGGNLKQFDIEIGSGSLVPGFEDQLIGKKVGETVNVKITFPKDYPAAALAAQAARFELVVDALDRPNPVKVDDAMAVQAGFENLAKLRARMAEDAQADLTQASEQRLKRSLFDKLTESNIFAVPEGIVESELRGLWQSHVNDLRQRNITPEMAGKIEETRAEFRKVAERRVRLGLLLAEIAKREKLNVGEEDIQKAIEEQAVKYGNAERVRAFYQSPQNRAQLFGPVLEEKVVQFIFSKSTIADKKIDAKELLSELG